MDLDQKDKGHKLFHTITFGCQMNLNDSERLAGQLRTIGYEATENIDQANVILINTCCVRESAEKKIYGKIGEMKRLKSVNPNLIIGVVGCMAQKDKDKIVKKFPHVSLVMGTHNTHQLVELIAQIETSGEKVVSVWEQAERLAPDVPTVHKSQISAWVPIMYGCNNFCTYCIVPYVRGRERSRPLENIIAEIQQLGAAGFKEITLLGQNVNSYGKDLDTQVDFSDLLQAADQIETIPRIRYMTSHPRDMNTKLIEIVKNSKRICEHFHLPVQSGSNSILEQMNRGYTTAYYRQLVTDIRKAIPGASITTDLIVGFPGETEEQFLETLEFIKSVRYDVAYTFLYSQRSGTPAAQYEGQLPLAVKKARLNQLMAVQNEISLEINEQLTGTVIEVLVEGASKKDEMKLMGRTRTNKIVLWEKTGTEKIGDLVNIQIDKAQTWVLKGRLL
ncbi:tRNA-2-methylthio-N(6)-dimethylallyladenosine synthase [Sporomusa silvacetica DSM 10669]|uniref:tRNA-2-methylthio-N(6)-dimethylallyladenosine synthase n=1 Tax=Sporomusa silvacetica DSM 10669 TaxID=1123289 RepID=A0ABZ3IKS3_9FIRM|nr:tRNA (N6-isopentenyl adenosine(37)-C2)-methylthiotransferase MiaB [Sporomusa silvacetica]OZC13413.1 tRNA-2-methylthio-N(6)-dimethylallyladenosine synthase [Sporomusa silvacetica DSM 10669]